MQYFEFLFHLHVQVTHVVNLMNVFCFQILIVVLLAISIVLKTHYIEQQPPDASHPIYFDES